MFRIGKKHDVKAYLTINGKLASALLDSGFTKIEQVVNVLNRKVNDYNRPKQGGNVLVYTIINEDKNEVKTIEKTT